MRQLTNIVEIYPALFLGVEFLKSEFKEGGTVELMRETYSF
jgi:hypothetical protein